MMAELSSFWQSFEIDEAKLQLDTDQLQGIVIYIVSRMQYPAIIADVSICEAFLPPAVKKSSRYLYLEMVNSACEYLMS